MNIVALKNHSYIHTYKYKVVGKEVGICINIIASKGVIVVPNYYPTSGYQNLLLSNSTLNSTQLEFHSYPSWIKNLIIRRTNKVELHLCIYVPTTSPKWESLQATFKHHQCASLWNLNFNSQTSYTPLQLKGGAVNLHYMAKEATRYKAKRARGWWPKGWRMKDKVVTPLTPLT